MIILLNGTNISFDVASFDDACGIIERLLNKYKYVEHVPGQTAGAVTSYTGYNDPDETGYMANETWSVWEKTPSCQTV